MGVVKTYLMVSLRSLITQKLLNYFFLNQDEERYVRELAKMFEIDPKNLGSKLKELEVDGLLKSEMRGQERYYSLNKEFSLLNEYKGIVFKTVGIEFLLKDALERIDGVKEVYIFGSYAKNKMDAGSDVDVLVVGDQSVLDVQRAVVKIMKNIGREINVVNMSVSELEKRKKAKDFFIEKIFSESTIKLV